VLTPKCSIELSNAVGNVFYQSGGMCDAKATGGNSGFISNDMFANMIRATDSNVSEPILVIFSSACQVCMRF
jgi:hypothetical protein